MCGIAGFLGKTGNPRTIISNMTERLHHRGPDEGGIWLGSDGLAALGHRRLSILDLSPTGAQPMRSASGRFIISFNGEIYNFRDLRNELEKTGYPFKGHSDTEVLLAAVELWGTENALRSINGMFAFALWDRDREILLLARDRVGKKPLYYGWNGSVFLFASELKALEAFPGFDTTLDRNALGEFIRYGWIPEPLSIYGAINKLPPACLLRITPQDNPGSSAPVYYWQANTVCKNAAMNTKSQRYDDSVARLDDLLSDAVGARMIADVEVGALLSGGIDSTTVVALMQSQTTRPVKTFSIGFHEPRFNEAKHALEIARHLGTEHNELYVTPEQCLDTVMRLPHVYDEPFADISQVPTLLVAELASNQVKVVLSGDGGDELFCGYTHYFEAQRQWQVMQKLPLWLRRILRRLIRRYADTSWRWFEKSLEGHTKPPGWKRAGTKLEKRTRGWDSLTPQELLLGRYAHHMEPTSLVIGAEDIHSNISNKDLWVNEVAPLLQMQHMDFIGFLPDDILVKVDRASMSVGLEVRSPILDTRVAEFAWSMPHEYLVDHRGGKRILRDVMQRYIPRKLTERKKRGFSPPVEDWLRGPLYEWASDLLDPTLLDSQRYFNSKLVQEAWKQHLYGWRNHSNLIWSLLMFQAWLLAKT